MTLQRPSYVDGETPVLPPGESLLDLIHADSGGHRVARILPFRPLPGAAPCVLLSFERRDDRWFCDFYESTGTARIRETLSYSSSGKVVSIAKRGGAFMDGNSRSRLYQGIQIGRGSILLNLTSEQYNKLIAA